MEQKTVGAQTRRLRTCPSVLSFAAVGGRFEGEGPLREYFDELSEDHFFGEKTWEKGSKDKTRTIDQTAKINRTVWIGLSLAIRNKARTSIPSRLIKITGS